MLYFLSTIIESHIYKVFSAIIIAFVITYLIIPQIVNISIFKRLFDIPNQRSTNRFLVPNLGGIGIFTGTIITFLTICSDNIVGEVNSIIGLTTVLFLVAIKDDLIGISARKKFIYQLLIFTYAAIVLDIRILNLDGFLGINELDYFTSILLTILIYFAIVNSLNLIDGIDGLFGSIGLFISLFLGWQFWGNTYQSYSLLNFALVGSLMAFLLFNIFGRKNKIFAGDAGTVFVGFILAVSAVKSINVDFVPNSRIISLFALPLFDTVRVFIIRIYSKRSPFSPDMNHIHHLLLKNGLSHLKATIVILMFSLACFFSVLYIPVNATIILIILFLIFTSSAYILSNNRIARIFKTITEFLNEIPFEKSSINIATLPNDNSPKIFTLPGGLSGFIKNKIMTEQKLKPAFDLVELYHSLRLKSNPFSRFSAEEEIEYLDEIYYLPNYFKPLFADIKNGHTRFILGARGIGKTALLIKLVKQLDRNNIFTIIIDDYDNIPNEKNGKYFLKYTIKRIVREYCILISNSPTLMKKLKNSDKEKLTFFIENFFDTITPNEYLKYVDITSKYKSKKWIIKTYNFIVYPVNSLLSFGMEIGGDMIKKSLGLNNYDSAMVYKDYIKEIKEFNPNKSVFIESANYSTYKEIICDLSKIIKKSGFNQVVILYDKIDENKEFGGDLNKITAFLTEILSDTSLLLNKDFGLVFSLWNELKENLSKIHVRFDKILPIDVTWSNNELLQIMDVRLSYFSAKPQAIVKLDEIIEESRNIEEIIKLSNKSPRDLLRLISSIYYEQANIDNLSPFMSTQAVKKGIFKFIKEYDYYSIYPQINANDDILKNLNKILTSGKLTFKISDFAQDLSISITKSTSIIKNLSKQGVVNELNKTQGNAKIYEIIDPKIVWLIRNQMNPWSN